MVEEHRQAASIDHRLTILESEFGTLVQELRKSEESRGKWEERIGAKLDQLGNKRTDWSVILTGLSVAIVIGALSFKPVLDDAARIETRLIDLENKLVDEERRLRDELLTEVKDRDESILRETAYRAEMSLQRDVGISQRLVELERDRAYRGR